MKLTKAEIETLKILYKKGEKSKSEIAKYTQLSTFVVSSTLERLKSKSFVKGTPGVSSKRGRPSSFYSLNPEAGYFLGISADIKSFNVILIDSLSGIIKKENHSINIPFVKSNNNLNIFLNKILFIIDDFIKNNSSFGRKIKAIGLGVPGIIDSDSGIWLRGLRISGIKNINIREIIQEKYRIPVFIDDVAATVTHYEKVIGRGKNVDNFFLIHLGFGLGGTIVINKEIYRGTHGFAGEIGHLIVEPSGYRCHCGNIGCLETVASMDGILRRFNDKMNELVVSKMHSHDFYKKQVKTLEDILILARKGDKFTHSVLYEIGSFLGDACSNVILFFNPEKIIISGPNVILADYLRDAINFRIKNRVISEMLSDFELIFSDYSQEYEAYGAALMASEIYWKKNILKEDKI